MLTCVRKTVSTKAKYAVAIMAAGACLALAPSWCLAADAEAGSAATEWKKEIEADWMLQLARAAKTFGLSREQHARSGCDGVKDGDSGFHTGYEENPWWQVGFEKPQSIARIVVYNTSDNPQRASNLRILLANDWGRQGSKWREVYRHDGQIFGGAKDGKPLVVQLKGESAQTVRVTLSGKEYLHLAEVEVYGSDAPEQNLALKQGERGWADQSSVIERDTAPADWKPRAPAASVKKEIPKALERAERLCADLRGMANVPDLGAEAAAIERLREEVKGVETLDAEAAKALYLKIRWAGRNLAMTNPLVSSRPILFIERHRGGGYMLYEYLGYYLNHATWGPVPEAPGGGIFVLQRPGLSPAAREIVLNPALKGYFVTLSLSLDAKTIYFAHADPTGKDGPYNPFAPLQPDVKYNTFHIWAMSADGSGLRALTDGPDDDFDPCPLPDGGIAFMSTRRGAKLRCGGNGPEAASSLYRMDADGKNIRALSFHETHEWHPAVLNDGRIVYTRWDYVDRNAAYFHGLWTCNPDGSNPAALFGNYTTNPQACYQAKAVPGSHKVLFVGGGHHANVGGTLMMLDPARVGLNSRTGEDRGDSLERLTPEVVCPESEGQPKSYYYSPWPLSENYFLVAYSHDPMFGGYMGTQREGKTGLYYFDRFGNLELLYRRKGISAAYPIPLAPRTPAPARSGDVGTDLGAEGEFLLSDVNNSLLPLPADRPIVELRVFQILPQSTSGPPAFGHKSPYDVARMLLGTVPVEKDGSAYFRAPARKPLYFQAVDASGRAVQGMKSVVYLQPGERRSCVGCHEPPGTALARREAVAFRRPPSSIQHGPDGSLPFSYPRLVQPVLDRNCVKCHDGSTGADKSPLVLTGATDQKSRFSTSFDNLKPHLRWPGDTTITRPGQVGADLSPLSAVLTSEKHVKYVKVPDQDLRTIYLWLDAESPFYGVYEGEDRAKQKLGEAVPPPRLQ